MNLGSNLRESEQFFLPSLSPLLVFFSPYSPLPLRNAWYPDYTAHIGDFSPKTKQPIRRVVLNYSAQKDALPVEITRQQEKMTVTSEIKEINNAAILRRFRLSRGHGVALWTLSLFWGGLLWGSYSRNCYKSVTTECHWSTYAKGRQKREDGKPCLTSLTIIMYDKHSNV